ncbi:hypothetical protein JTE90_007141 [Oedothorax gibbosus]|uniref:Serpin domain-containing protein n=1 Tax=Oedothorax gibbosus TaxID=931172 RepID=A0AAV6VQB5_9ARAC|nr:hypothetical protein JTE90_007141 [Oedothorax gibbosus]
MTSIKNHVIVRLFVSLYVRNIFKMIFSRKIQLATTIITITWAFSFSSGETTEANLKKLSTANNIFAISMHKSLSVGPDKNVFFSPLSLSTVLAMLYYGVRGNSAKELRQTLGYNDADLQDKDVHSSFHELLRRFSNATSRGYILQSANVILVKSSLHLRPDYKKSIRDLYMSPVESVDFAKDGQRIVEGVNGWVENKTGGTIRQVLKYIDPEIAMIVLNAVYFKGKWKNPFKRRQTRMADFFNGGLPTSKKVQMMELESTYLPYTDSDDYQAVELPYEGEDLSMLVLLPKANDSLPSLEQSITAAKLEEIRQRMSPREMDLYLPKFTFEFQKNLRGELQSLGLHSIFKEGSEDFSGMTLRQLTVSQVIHKCKVEVNEEGTRAAASTAVMLVPFSARWNTVFRADHPFLFFIIKKVDGLILFMGRVSQL